MNVKPANGADARMSSTNAAKYLIKPTEIEMREGFKNACGRPAGNFWLFSGQCAKRPYLPLDFRAALAHPRAAGFHGCARHRTCDCGHGPSVECLRDDEIVRKLAVRHHRGKRFGCRKLHAFGYRAAAHQKRTPEGSGKAEHVVYLVRKVRPRGTDHA